MDGEYECVSHAKDNGSKNEATLGKDANYTSPREFCPSNLKASPLWYTAHK